MPFNLKPVIVPLLPMREEIVFPGSTVPFFVGRQASMDALDRALEGDRGIFVVTQRDSAVENPQESDLFEIGVLGRVIQVMRLPNGTVKALFEGSRRGKLLVTKLAEKEYLVQVQPVDESAFELDQKKVLELAETVRELFKSHVEKGKIKLYKDVLESLEDADAISVSDRVVSLMELPREQKQQLLETLNPETRLQKILDILRDEMKIVQLEDKLKKEATDQFSDTKKEDFLQNQLRNIQKELGQMDDPKAELDEIADQIKKAGMPEEVEIEAQKELKKLRMMSPMSSEANVVRNYLEWLSSMPWQVRTDDNFDLKQAEKILDEDHYGLEKIKERIVEYIAVASLKGKLKGPILCLTGPPGVGKTSLAKSVARALGRNFVRISLGGVRDEAEIRGHRRTYIGAMPGKIIQSIKKAKSNNPVLLIDEIDKLYQSNISDPSAAMLEVLDPEQNNTFIDHYLDVEYSLADVLFICTANSVQNITGPLLDRMEVIHLSGYTELEKQHIATQFLAPRQRKFHGLDEKQLRFRKSAIEEITQGYTREAGVRNLEREIGKVCRKIVTRLVRNKGKKSTIVTPKLVHDLLGVPQFQHDKREDKNEIGVSMGLGVTPMGGELLLIEVGLMSGSGKVVLTGKLGDVMQESARAAFSYVRSNADYLGIDPDIFAKTDLHVHLPEGATPKDGPSAGLPLMMAIISSFTKISVKNNVAMTGEITLRGHVTEIGGLKEKLIAAKRGLIDTVLIPDDNEKDLVEIPDEIKNGMEIIALKNVKDALEFALEAHPNFVKDQKIIVPDISWTNSTEAPPAA
ncbi:MAG: endopeptidase La [SAR324 cluster bacterium]|jgi:ATP-dependent Lon protease|nr:endopeptidase La [SAR324 cluster bacterium]MCH2266405.1 endopeptidase La [SAR324 cluster bacterium]